MLWFEMLIKWCRISTYRVCEKSGFFVCIWGERWEASFSLIGIVISSIPWDHQDSDLQSVRADQPLWKWFLYFIFGTFLLLNCLNTWINHSPGQNHFNPLKHSGLNYLTKLYRAYTSKYCFSVGITMCFLYFDRVMYFLPYLSVWNSNS